MNVTEVKPLKPLDSGIVLLVGVKASNFDDELKTHPRVVMWDSQNEHWTNKDLPSNTRAVFMTRFLGHAAFANIVAQARKRQITIFNPNGTGVIARQVKELLSIGPKEEVEVEVPEVYVPTERVWKMKEEETEVVSNKGRKLGEKGKLNALIPFIDFNKNNIDNARGFLAKKAKELGIETTEGSIAQFVMKQRQKRGQVSPEKKKSVESKDVTVEMFDAIIKQLQDMRQFFVATVAENNSLRAKLESLKKALS